MDWANVLYAMLPDRLKARLTRSIPHGGGWYSEYGEPPPSAVTATPTLYMTSSAVNVAVGEITDRAASTPWHLYRVAADGERTEIARHKALSLLDDPNSFMTRYELIAYTLGDYLLAGNAYWFLAGSAGSPVEIWRLNPRHVRLVRDNEKFVRGYLYEVDGREIPLDPLEVHHHRAPNFLDDFWGYGLPRLYAAALAAQTGVDMAKWNRSSFTGKNVGVPAGIVNVQEYVSDADYERIKREWTEKYSGPDRMTALIRGGTVSYQKIALTQADVDFINGMGWTRNEVFDVFRAYHLKTSGGAESEGAIKVRERLFLEGGLWPLLCQIAEKITDDLLPFYGRKGSLVLEFEDIRPRERALELQEQQERARGLFFNEWRTEHGLDPDPKWDGLLFTHVVAQGLMPLEVRQALTPPPPPQLAPFTGGQAPASEASQEARESDQAMQEDRTHEDAEDRATEQQARGEDVGDDIGAFADKSIVLARTQKTVSPSTPNPADVGRELALWQAWAIKRASQLATFA